MIKCSFPLKSLRLFSGPVCVTVQFADEHPWFRAGCWSRGWAVPELLGLFSWEPAAPGRAELASGAAPAPRQHQAHSSADGARIQWVTAGLWPAQGSCLCCFHSIQLLCGLKSHVGCCTCRWLKQGWQQAQPSGFQAQQGCPWGLRVSLDVWAALSFSRCCLLLLAPPEPVQQSSREPLSLHWGCWLRACFFLLEKMTSTI